MDKLATELVPSDLSQGTATLLGLGIVIGLSYALAAVNQALFDNRLKGNFDAASVAYFDPIDARWQEINADNGDDKQALIDELVAEQHRGMRDAACVIYQLASRHIYRLSYDKRPADAGGHRENRA